MDPESTRTLDDLAEEYVARLRAREPADPEEYVARRPDLAERIREVFPVLALMEGLKAPAAASTEPAAEPESEADRPDTIGPYRVVREIGRGGMGRVYEARDARGGRCALKVVHPQLLGRPGFLARFLREVDAGLRVEHPGVVRTIESGVAELDGTETPYLVLEYVEGTTLRALVAETGGISERLAREIGCGVAEALAAIHAAGMVHRDVKPENVLITPDERIKLMDLGVALVQEEALRLTQTGEFVGSLLYAAPEQLRTANVDGRADLYALGLLLFELVAGAHPEARREGNPLARRLGPEGMPRVAAVVPGATRFFDHVVARLLAAEPRLRFDAASEVATLLREGEAGAWWRGQEQARRMPVRPRRFADAQPLCGREDELAALDAAFRLALKGHGQVRVIEAEAGVGKSRLVDAWLERAEASPAAPALVWIEHAPGKGALGLAPIARALDALLDEDREARVRAWLGDREDRAPEVLASLDGGSGPAAVGDGGLDSAALETLYVLLLRGLAREHGLVIVTEDLHFATAEGRDLFHRLAHSLSDAPVLLLGTTRPAQPAWPSTEFMRLPHVDRVEVGGLTDAASFELLAGILGHDHPALDAMRALVRTAEGNPYFLLEFAHELRRRAGQRGAGGVPDAVLALPRSVRQMVDERLRALDAEDRELLALAACCGDRFDPIVVCAAAELPRLGGLRALHRIEREHRLVRAEGADYRFSHHLMQEALQEELPPALKAAYHTALGRALEAGLGADASETDALDLARHFLLGDEPALAAPYALRAVEHLNDRAEFRRAARLADRILEHLPDLPDEERVRVLHCRGLAAFAHEPPKAALPPFQAALALADRLGDESMGVRLLTELALATRNLGDGERALEYTRQAVARGEALGEPGVLARALGEHAMALAGPGRLEEAREAAQRGLDLAREARRPDEVCSIGRNLGGILLDCGRLEEAREILEMAATVGHLHGARVSEASSLTVLGKIAYMQCELGDAISLMERVRAIGREIGHVRMATVTGVNIAQTLVHVGRLEEARSRAQDLVDTSRQMGYRDVEAHALLALGHAQSCLGDIGGAHETLSRARDILSDSRSPVLEARLSATPANLLAAMGRFEEAEDLLERGARAAAEANAPRETIIIQQARASLLEARGRIEEAEALLAEALGQARAMDLRQLVAHLGQRAGELACQLGRDDDAVALLEEARRIAGAGGLAGAEARSAVWADLVGEGNLRRAALTYERDRSKIPAPARLRLLLELARRTGSDAFRAEARELARAMIASVPEPHRGPMRTAVPLYVEALAPSRG